MTRNCFQWQLKIESLDLHYNIPFLKAISDERDVNQLSCHFTKQEEENFALFSYVNELSYEVEVLNETVQQFRNDIGKIRFIFSSISNQIKSSTSCSNKINSLY